jgi:hypothetical protein
LSQTKDRNLNIFYFFIGNYFRMTSIEVLRIVIVRSQAGRYGEAIPEERISVGVGGKYENRIEYRIHLTGLTGSIGYFCPGRMPGQKSTYRLRRMKVAPFHPGRGQKSCQSCRSCLHFHASGCPRRSSGVLYENKLNHGFSVLGLDRHAGLDKPAPAGSKPGASRVFEAL